MKKLLLILIVLCNVNLHSQISDLPPSCNGTFNLGVKRAEILGANPNYHTLVMYYLTADDAVNFTNPINDFRNYYTASLPQIIYTGYVNPNDGSHHLDNFNLVQGPTSTLYSSASSSYVNIYAGASSLNSVAYQWYTEDILLPPAYQNPSNLSGLYVQFPGRFYAAVTDATCSCVSYTNVVELGPMPLINDNLVIHPVNEEITVSSESVSDNDPFIFYQGGCFADYNQLPPGFALDYNGYVSVLPGTQPGFYTFPYIAPVVYNPYTPYQQYYQSDAYVTVEIPSEGFVLKSFLDANNNGTKEADEPIFNLGKFNYEFNNNGVVHDVTSSTGEYAVYEANPANSYDLGFAVDPVYSSYYNVTTPSYSNVNVVVNQSAQEYNFPVTVTQNYNDLYINVFAQNRPRPGFSYTNVIMYKNEGSMTMVSGIVTFTKSSALSITDISESGTTPIVNGFTYGFTDLLPGETRYIYVTLQVDTIPAVALGDMVISSVSITPVAGDLIPSNNTGGIKQIIVGSYDPNDKVESHGGKIQYSTFTSNDYLTYTIQFENTGSDSAINVRLEDLLDAKLDETSVKMIDASHGYTLNRAGNNLKWNFANIFLPPSFDDSTIGKGYVSFQVKPKAGYTVGDIIPNKADIYFDFNPAIVTNTFNTEFVALLGVAEFEKAGFKVYPNPTAGLVTISLKENTGTIDSVQVLDLLGKILQVKKANASVAVIDLSNLTAGIYFVKVTSDGQEKVMKVVRQ
ncbi:T9SS type A sorting domain-containing protein [Flavobacterium sp.]|uniref:T9SS type A sorting domain-containing protein n=1 Tax=Flavobacterium sp. TaxID=239 RepID=UPI003D6BA76A